MGCIELRASWREAFAEWGSAAANKEDDENGCIRKHRAVELQRSEIKLTPEQLEQACALLQSDTPFGEMAQRDGVLVRARGEKLTPTQRKLTEEQQEEARALMQPGASLSAKARRLRISRCALGGILGCALEGILKKGMGERA